MVGVQGYNEDQIALLVPDLLNFVAQVPIILGTPTISHVVNVMKEREIDALAMPQANTRVAHLLSVQRATATVEVSQAVLVVRNSTAYPQTLKKKTPVAQAVAATMVPESPVMTNLPEGVEEPNSLQAPKLTIRQRQGRQFEEMDLSGLESWPPELADSA